MWRTNGGTIRNGTAILPLKVGEQIRTKVISKKFLYNIPVSRSDVFNFFTDMLLSLKMSRYLLSDTINRMHRTMNQDETRTQARSKKTGRDWIEVSSEYLQPPDF